MSGWLESMKNRRSVRCYKPDPVPQELLDQIMEAGLYAASARGQQNTIMIQVSDRELRDEIVRRNCASAAGKRALIRFTARRPW